MKPITFLLAVLAIGLLPGALGAQSNVPAEPVNYYAEFADLMHGKMDAKEVPVATFHTNRFPAFVYYREVTNSRAEDFLAYFEKIVAPSVPPAHAVFAEWTVRQGYRYDEAFDYTAYTARSVQDCSSR